MSSNMFGGKLPPLCVNKTRNGKRVAFRIHPNTQAQTLRTKPEQNPKQLQT